MDLLDELKALLAKATGTAPAAPPAPPPQVAHKSVLLKTDDADRMVYGFASVSVAKGSDVVDSHKHEITTKAIRKLMHGVIAGQRAGKLLHKGGKQTDIVESIVLEPNLWKALGAYLQDIGEITADQAQVFKTITFEGALVGFHVGDDSLWKLAQETDFELSIGVEEATLMEVK